MTGSRLSDKLSDMKTYMVRELSRQTAKVLSACDKDGSVVIQYQDGREYTLMPRRATVKDVDRVKRFKERRRELRAAWKGREFSSRQIDRLLDANRSDR